MIGIAEDIADRLIALGFGQLVPKVTIFTGDLPAAPDDVIVVREMQGAAPLRAMGRVVMDRPDVQVIVRRVSYTALTAAVTGIKGDGSGSGLDGWSGTIDGKAYYFVELAYEPVYMGRDENNRRQTSMVFRIHKQR